ncbi:helix-turn-helix domain-containing protein [Geminicoccus flavidas]|uniref:helix-turn-helix domain-containing protein n=1 Tax=Geminicoccus flavidas TaxID=2506407 RepID=UPI00135C7B99|nr:XRE family transcriptional regulator [Geminicoccus flavidas]
MFANLDYPDAEERQTKLQLAHAINAIITQRRLMQPAASEKFRVRRPKVSALANYKLEGFAVERLMTFVMVLDRICSSPFGKVVGTISDRILIISS